MAGEGMQGLGRRRRERRAHLQRSSLRLQVAHKRARTAVNSCKASGEWIGDDWWRGCGPFARGVMATNSNSVVRGPGGSEHACRAAEACQEPRKPCKQAGEAPSGTMGALAPVPPCKQTHGLSGRLRGCSKDVALGGCGRRVPGARCGTECCCWEALTACNALRRACCEVRNGWIAHK